MRMQSVEDIQSDGMFLQNSFAYSRRVGRHLLFGAIFSELQPRERERGASDAAHCPFFKLQSPPDWVSASSGAAQEVFVIILEAS